MKILSIAELQGLKTQIEARKQVKALSVLTADQALALVEQAIEDRRVINRWFGFLKLMAERSSWSEQIKSLLNDYLYGTEDVKVQEAAQRYIERAKLHEKTR